VRYLLFVAVLLSAICVIDFAMEPTQACANREVACAVCPCDPAMPTVAMQPSLKDTCETAPLIVDENLSRIQSAPRVRWFPGKNILRAIRNIRNR